MRSRRQRFRRERLARARMPLGITYTESRDAVQLWCIRCAAEFPASYGAHRCVSCGRRASESDRVMRDVAVEAQYIHTLLVLKVLSKEQGNG